MEEKESALKSATTLVLGALKSNPSNTINLCEKKKRTKELKAPDLSTLFDYAAIQLESYIVDALHSPSLCRVVVKPILVGSGFTTQYWNQFQIGLFSQ